MWPLDTEPKQDQLEAMQVDEELEFIHMTDVPEDVRSEVLERIERFEETDLEAELPEGTPPEP